MFTTMSTPTMTGFPQFEQFNPLCQTINGATFVPAAHPVMMHKPVYQSIPTWDKLDKFAYQPVPTWDKPAYQSIPTWDKPAYQSIPTWDKPAYQSIPTWDKPAYQSIPTWDKLAYQSIPTWNKPVHYPVPTWNTPVWKDMASPATPLQMKNLDVFGQLPVEFINHPLVSTMPIHPGMESLKPSIADEIALAHAMGQTLRPIPTYHVPTPLDSFVPTTSGLLPKNLVTKTTDCNPFAAPLQLKPSFEKFPVAGIPGYSSVQTQGTINPLSDVRYIDNATETIIDCFLPGVNAEGSEVVSVGDEIRVRCPLKQIGPDMLNMTKGTFSLPLPKLGDGSRLQAQAKNDFLRITVPTAANVANQIQKVNLAKIG